MSSKISSTSSSGSFFASAGSTKLLIFKIFVVAETLVTLSRLNYKSPFLFEIIPRAACTAAYD